ncbi:MAG: type III-A CRISPR-associated protein Cas10/Csm1 [Anaerolineae bacterium]
MEHSVFVAAVAGLLHDIGKFAFRAGEQPKIGWEQANREAHYAHAQKSWEVVQEIVPAGWVEEMRPILYHHHLADATKEKAVDPVLAYRLALADWLSSGEREEKPEEEGGKDVPYVRSPFSRLCGYDVERYYPAVPLSSLAPESAMPAERSKGQSSQDFARLWKQFWEQIEGRLERSWGGNEEAFLEALYALLEEYTWCVPSAYAGHVADISLFDHARTTAAIAVCLTADGRDQAWCGEVMDALRDKGDAGEALGRETALLVAGDITGVQKFIYTITSSGAAKSLRGRSFYLQLLTEAVARYVLRELGLPVTNLIYAGGGNFVLLAPTSAKEGVENLRREIAKKLVQAHDGELNLVMAHVPVRAGEFRIREFHQVWKGLHKEALDREKQHPFTQLDNVLLGAYLGAPMGEGGDTEKECSVCGKEFDKPARVDISGAEVVRVCATCAGFEALGNELAKAKWLVGVYFAPQGLTGPARDWRSVLRSFGMDFWAVEDLHQVSVAAKPAVLLVTSLEGKDASKATTDTEDLIHLPAYRFFAQLVPTRRENYEEHILTFDELCEESKGGFKRWGVLRMDVDNLGWLFQKGFEWNGVNHLTLSRAASLSFALRMFFEGLVAKMATEETLENRLYLQYAGGDDLFMVGSWDALPVFALGLREKFREFVCHNPAVTLSAGIALAPEKYPLYQAAEDAGRAEKQAKHFRRPNGGHEKEKDACHFLEFTMDWGDLAKAREWAGRFEAWCEGSEPKVPKAFVQLLIQLYAGYREEREQAVRAGRCRSDQVYFGPWMWRLAYYLGRRRAESQMPEEVKQKLEELERYMLVDPRHVDIVGLAARWAHYLVR